MTRTQKIPQPPKQSDQPQFEPLEAPRIEDVLAEIDKVYPAEPDDAPSVQLLTKLRAFLGDRDNWCTGSLKRYNAQLGRNQYCLIGGVAHLSGTEGLLDENLSYGLARSVSGDDARRSDHNAMTVLRMNSSDRVDLTAIGRAVKALMVASSKRGVVAPHIYNDGAAPHSTDNGHAKVMRMIDDAIAWERNRIKETK